MDLIWIPHSTSRWCLAELVRVVEDVAIVRTDDGTEEFLLEDVKIFSRSHGTDCLDDISLMEDLHPAPILYLLQRRFVGGAVCTWAGDVMVFINPFADGDLELTNHINARSSVIVEDLAHKVFDRLSAHKHANLAANPPDNQVIMLNGQSGSGKSTSTKKIINYLVDLSAENRSGVNMHAASASSADSARSLSERVLRESSFILESFGHAASMRNKYSSRFGRCTKMAFRKVDRVYCMVGARTSQYFLDTNRIIGQDPGESSFHVFYQLLSAMNQQRNPPEKPVAEDSEVPFNDVNAGRPLNFQALRISMDTSFKYLKGASAQSIAMDAQCDAWAQGFVDLQRAMLLAKITPGEQDLVFQTLTTILTIGNLQFQQQGSNVVLVENSTTTDVCALFGVMVPDLQAILCGNTTHADATTAQVRYVQHASLRRHELARTLYAATFDWILQKLNEATKADAIKNNVSITVLDFFGFENLEHNSLEQLYINYISERLLRIFYETTIAHEYRFYENEGLELPALKLCNSTELLIALSDPLNGIFRLIDDAKDDLELLHQIVNTHSTIANQDCAGFDPGFVVQHWRGDVKYEVTGFVIKNSEMMVSRDLSSFMAKSRFNLFFSQPVARTSSGTKQFCAQLDLLFEDIADCKPSFVRCISSNPYGLPMDFDLGYVADQLPGIYEAISVKQMNYPSRRQYSEVVDTFKHILKKEEHELLLRGKLDLKQCVMDQLSQFLGPPGIHRDWQLGHKLVFLKDYNRLERIIQAAVRPIDPDVVIKIVAWWKSMYHRRKYIKARNCLRRIAARVKGFLVRLRIRQKEDEMARIKKELERTVLKPGLQKYKEVDGWLQREKRLGTSEPIVETMNMIWGAFKNYNDRYGGKTPSQSWKVNNKDFAKMQQEMRNLAFHSQKLIDDLHNHVHKLIRPRGHLDEINQFEATYLKKSCNTIKASRKNISEAQLRTELLDNSGVLPLLTKAEDECQRLATAIQKAFDDVIVDSDAARINWDELNGQGTFTLQTATIAAKKTAQLLCTRKELTDALILRETEANHIVKEFHVRVRSFVVELKDTSKEMFLSQNFGWEDELQSISEESKILVDLMNEALSSQTISYATKEGFESSKKEMLDAKADFEKRAPALVKRIQDFEFSKAKEIGRKATFAAFIQKLKGDDNPLYCADQMFDEALKTTLQKWPLWWRRYVMADEKFQLKFQKAQRAKQQVDERIARYEWECKADVVSERFRSDAGLEEAEKEVVSCVQFLVRNGQAMAQEIENLWTVGACTKIQAMARGFMQRRHFSKTSKRRLWWRNVLSDREEVIYSSVVQKRNQGRRFGRGGTTKTRVLLATSFNRIVYLKWELIQKEAKWVAKAVVPARSENLVIAGERALDLIEIRPKSKGTRTFLFEDVMAPAIRWADALRNLVPSPGYTPGYNWGARTLVLCALHCDTSWTRHCYSTGGMEDTNERMNEEYIICHDTEKVMISAYQCAKGIIGLHPQRVKHVNKFTVTTVRRDDPLYDVSALALFEDNDVLRLRGKSVSDVNCWIKQMMRVCDVYDRHREPASPSDTPWYSKCTLPTTDSLTFGLKIVPDAAPYIA